jgi:hypothetical protein
MDQDLGTPIPPTEVISEPPKKKNNTVIIVLIVVLVVMLCCCLIAAIGGVVYLWNNGDQLLGISYSAKTWIASAGSKLISI